MAFTKILPAGISTTGTVTLERVETTNSIVSLGSTNQLYINTDTPTVRPTLDLNFERDQRLDSRITFSRDSTATYLGSDGLIKTAQPNIPRFEFDTDGNCLGLLIEESRSNLFPVSGDATDVNWTKLAVTTETDITVTAPDGTLGATKVIQDNTTAQHLIGDTVAGLTLGGYYALSVFVKKGTNTGKIYFSVASFSNWVNPDWQFYIDGDTGIVTNLTNVSAANLKVEQYPNGWWRLSMVAQQEPAGSGSGGFWVGFGEPGGSDVSNFTGDGSSYFYVWGGQMEAGSFATSYIPTSGSTVTRSADIAQITGTNFTDFYNQTEGSYFFNAQTFKNVAGNIYYGESGNGSANRNIMYANTSNGNAILYYTENNNNPVNTLSAGYTFAPNTSVKTAYCYKQNDFGVFATGGLSNFVTSGNIHTANSFSIGMNNINNGEHLNGHIKQLTYYPQRLSNDQLQNLTS